MTTYDPAQHDPPAEGERWAAQAFATLQRGAPRLDSSIDSQAVWARISGDVASARGRSNGWLAALPALFTTRALTAAGVAVAAVVAVTVFTLSSGGGRADAALLEAARSLSSATDAALADGLLSDSELDTLRGDAEGLLADIVADPAGLERLSADDLAALATILNSLEDRLRAAEAATTPTFQKVESAAGLAVSALRTSNPDHAIVTPLGGSRDEHFSVAATGRQTIIVAAAGSVVIDVQANSLAVVGTTANPGWTAVVESAVGRELEVAFRSVEARVKFNAELEDGVLRTRIETDGTAGNSNSGASGDSDDRSAGDSDDGDDSDSKDRNSGDSDDEGDRNSDDDDDRDSDDGNRSQSRDEARAALAVGSTATYPVAGAGAVTILRTGAGLVIAGTAAASGWTVEVETPTGREVEADFRRGSERIKFNAELEDGQVRIRIEGVASAKASPTGTPSSSGSSGSSGSDDDDRRDDDDDDDDERDGDDRRRKGGNSGSGSGS